jgi:hypothetical protein
MASTKRTSRIPKPLRSATNWIRGSHRRLLIAALLAVGIVGAVSAFAAPPERQNITVWVNPRPAMNGVAVTSSGNGSGCDGVTKHVANDKVVFNCKYNVHVRITVQNPYNGYTVPSDARVFNTKDNANVEFNFNPPNNGGTTAPVNPGNGGQPAQNDDRAQVKVWVNPRPALNGMGVTLSGAGCNDQGTKHVDSNNANGGALIWGNCKVGETVKVSMASKTLRVGDWDYMIGKAGDGTESRDKKVAKADSDNVMEFNYYGGAIPKPGDNPTAQIKVVVNPTDKTAGKANVSISGGKCNVPGGDSQKNTQTRPVGAGGYVLFAGCEVGSGYRVKIDQTQFSDGGQVWYLGPAGPNPVSGVSQTERYLPHLDPKPSEANPVSWTPAFDFALPTASSAGEGSLTVKSFKDANCDGKQQTGEEAAVPNAPFKYSFGNTNDYKDGNTGATGTAVIAGLQAGPYPIKVESAPTGYKSCFPENWVAQVQPGSGGSVAIGYQALPQPAGTGTVNALVFNDKNGNGSQDADEPGIKGVEVSAKLKSATDTDKGTEVKTNDQGMAAFSELPNGAYTVSAATAEGYTAVSAQAKDVTVNNDVQSVAFAQQQNGKQNDTPGNTENGGTTDSGDNGGLVDAVAGALPKTGTGIGLLFFATFLAASAAYYGGRKLIAKRHQK